MVQTFKDRNIDVDKADVTGLREAFTMLAEAEAGTVHLDIVDTTPPSNRRDVPYLRPARRRSDRNVDRDLRRKWPASPMPAIKGGHDGERS